MLRKLALSLAIAGALGTSTAHALGLGEIRITSALNEPLQAEIQLLQMRSVDPQQVQPKMGNVDDFALAGIEKLRFLSDVKFQVKAGPSGQGTIVLTSTAPVKEPFLNFLLEVNWPSGRLVREYTVLLDPPIYDPTPPPVTVQPARSAAAGSSNTVAARPMAPQKPVNNIRTRMTDGQVYVDVNDTLWDIAKLHKPAGSVTEAQMMLALQRKNPEAFRNNNVNQLRAGVVMDIPSLSEVQALDRKQANEEFWRQTQRWKQGITSKAGAETEGLPPNTDKSGGMSGKKTNDVAARSAQGQLKIVSPEKTAETGGVSAQAADTDMSQADSELLKKNQQLETELASALETVDQIQRENEELSGRVDALAQQMESLQRLLELKDQHMAELQAELESAKSQPVTAPVVPAEAAPAVEKSLIEQFGLYIGAAGGALIAFLLALLLMRRGKKEEASDAAPAVAAAAATAAVADQVTDDEVVEAVAEETAADDLEPVIEDADLDDLDLDLDMDMEQVETAGENGINEDEFDLGFDDDFDSAPVASDVEEVEETEEIDDALDSILGENTDAFDINDLRVPEVEGLGDLPMDESEEEPEADNINDLLGDFDAPEGVEADVETELMPKAEPVSDETDLEFDLDSLADDSDAGAAQADITEDVASEDEFDLDFDLDEAEVTDANVVDVTEPAEVEELEFDLNDVADDAAVEELDGDDLTLSEFTTDEVAVDDSEADVDADAELDKLLAEGESDLEELDMDLDADLQAMLDGEDEVVLDETEIATPVNQASASQDLDAELDSELEMLLSDAGSDELSLDMTDDTEEYALDNLNLLEDADEVETKLDLARAYIDMEDLDGAKDILDEILKEGNEAQQSEANGLLNSIG
ncbi:FimV/HubP family polar landmark protein [Amphritea sp.]|uniref:FimV/HubP family polar landmark protein n=1 Tax=Amphritea sp. TaxID=1872502 RepID=UPI003A8FFA96